MDTTLDSQDRNELEEFLQELVLHIERPEEMDALVGILQEIKNSGVKMAQQEESHAGQRQSELGRYDIFRLHPSRIVRIGFVRGAENARKVLPHLNALGDGLYFLHETDPG